MAKTQKIDPSMFVDFQEEIEKVVEKTAEQSSESLDKVLGELSRVMALLAEVQKTAIEKENSQTVNVSFKELQSGLETIAKSIAETKQQQSLSLSEVGAIFDKLKSSDYTLTLESIAKALQEKNVMEYELDVTKFTKNDLIKTIHIKPILKQ